MEFFRRLCAPSPCARQLDKAFPTAGYANEFFYPEYTTHWENFGDCENECFSREKLVDRLGIEPRKKLEHAQLAALEVAINDYEKYITFRKSATEAKSYDRKLLNTYFRFAQLRNAAMAKK